MNTDLPGYSFISQPTLSNAGGVAFYRSNRLRFTMLSEYSIATEDFETLWIEIHNLHKSNLLCGVIYRHQHGDLDKFMNYLNTTLDKIGHSNKLCTVMGDFNLDLLHMESQ